MFADAIQKLVFELLRMTTFDAERASVVADWCETTGLQGGAAVLRSPEAFVEKAEILYGIAHLILPFDHRLPEAAFLRNVLVRTPLWSGGPNAGWLDGVRFIDSPTALSGIARLHLRQAAFAAAPPALLAEVLLPHSPRTGAYVVEFPVSMRIAPYQAIYATTPLGWRISANLTSE